LNVLKSSSLRWAWIAVLLVVVGLYGSSTFAPPLQDDVDSMHAEVSRQMAVRGDYVTSYVNGYRYLEKAPVLYWLVAICFQVFGVNEFSVRFPNALAILLLAALAMRWGWRAFGNRTSVYAGLFLVSAVGPYLFTRIMIPEAILSLFITGALYCFLTALEDGKAWRWYGAYLCMALALLTKGLMSLVVIGFPVLIYLGVSGEWRRWRELRLVSGLLLFFAVAAPWHVLAAIRNANGPDGHGFLWFYFMNEQFLRFLGKRIPHDYNKQYPSLFWGLHLVWLFPWSMYLPLAVRRLLAWWNERRSRTAAKALNFRRRSELMCFVWATVTLLFFSFSTNQEYYTYPAYMPILMLLAMVVAEAEESSEAAPREAGSGGRRWLVATSAALAVFSLIITAILAAGLWSSRHLPYEPDIGKVLAKPDFQATTLSMGHMLELTGESFAALRLPTVLAVIALGIGPVLALLLRWRGRHFAATWATAATMVLFLLAAHNALCRFDPYLGSSTMISRLAPMLEADDHVVIYGDESFGTTLLFYLQRPIQVVGQQTSLRFGSGYPDAPDLILTKERLLEEWNSPQEVYVLVPQHKRAEVMALLNPSQIVVESSGKVIFRNH